MMEISRVKALAASRHVFVEWMSTPVGLLAVLLLLLCQNTTAGVAQQSPLDRVVAAEHPISLHDPPLEKLVASRLWILSQVTALLVGFEESTTSVAATGAQPTGDLRGATVREALNRLVAADPRYEWREMDGLVVVRPVTAWADCSHFMNRNVQVPGGDFRMVEAIALLFRLVDPTTSEGRPFPGEISDQFTVKDFNGTVLQAFNHIARSGRLSWRVTYGPNDGGDTRQLSITAGALSGPQTGLSRALRPIPAPCGQP